MFTTDISLEECTQLWKSCAEKVAIFLLGAPVKKANLTIPSETTLNATPETVYLIKQGILKETLQGNIIIHYEDGDLVGADELFQSRDSTFTTDFAVKVDEYDTQELVKHIISDKARNEAWVYFLTGLAKSFKILIAHYKQQEIEFHPEVRNYKAGEIIIHEDATDDEVFTLLSGNALALVGETVVGEIKCDEIFGAIAALTDTPRTATIKAESDCTVLVVPSSRFKDLLTSRPDTVANLIQDMARTIISANKKIISLSH